MWLGCVNLCEVRLGLALFDQVMTLLASFCEFRPDLGVSASSRQCQAVLWHSLACVGVMGQFGDYCALLCSGVCQARTILALYYGFAMNVIFRLRNINWKSTAIPI